MTRSVFGGLAAAAAILALSACASSAAKPGQSNQPPPPSATASAQAMPVTLTRSGGFAGAVDRIVIQPAGAWVRTDKTGPDVRGQLTADQISQLRKLATDPGLKSPAPSPTAICADGYAYTLNVGDLKVSYTDCGTKPQTAAQLASLILGWTK